MKNLSKEYDEAYKKADALFKHYNPCEITKINGKISCNGGCSTDELCCVGCEHLTSNGCSVAALDCKLWLCYSIADDHPIRLELEKIKDGLSNPLKMSYYQVRTPKSIAMKVAKNGGLV